MKNFDHDYFEKAWLAFKAQHPEKAQLLGKEAAIEAFHTAARKIPQQETN